MNNEELIKKLVKEALDEDEELNELLKTFTNWASQKVDQAKGVGQNISATIQGAKAGLKGNVAGVEAANQQKANVARNFVKNQGQRIENDTKNYFNQLNSRIQNTAQNKSGQTPGDQNFLNKNREYLFARVLKSLSDSMNKIDTGSDAIKKTSNAILNNTNNIIKNFESGQTQSGISQQSTRSTTPSSPTQTSLSSKQTGSQQTTSQVTGQIGQQTQQKIVPIFKATPESKGDVLGMKLKPLLTKSGVKNPDELMKNYLKMISNQLKANGVKLTEAKGDNLTAQLSGFTSKTATVAGTESNIQKGSIDLFGPAILLLKQAGIEQKIAVTVAKQIQDLTTNHLKKYGVNLPQKVSRTPKQKSVPSTQNKVDLSNELTKIIKNKGQRQAFKTDLENLAKKLKIDTKGKNTTILQAEIETQINKLTESLFNDKNLNIDEITEIINYLF